jgi:hypothetical protein
LAAAVDKVLVSRFLDNAVSIFETASAAPADGNSPDLGILIDASGSLRIVDAAGWSPETLAAHYGARTVYHVTHTAGGVQVRGRSDGHTCVLESEAPVAPRRLFPNALPQYQVVSRTLVDSPRPRPFLGELHPALSDM